MTDQSACLVDGYVSSAEACRICGVSDGYMRRLIRDGKIVAKRFGNSYAVLRESAAAFQRQPGMGRPSNEGLESGEDILTSPTAARIAGLDRIHFARLIRDGKGPRYKTIQTGTRHIVLIIRDDLDEWIRSREFPSFASNPLLRRRVRVVPSERWYVLGRDRETCVYCGWKRGTFVPGSAPREIHVDHIVPFSRGGEPTRENLVCACSRCNLYKGDRTPDETGMEMKFLQPGVVYMDGSIFVVRMEGDQE